MTREEIINTLKSFLGRPDIKQALENNDFKNIYESMLDGPPINQKGYALSYFIPYLTELFYSIGLDPLKHMTIVPEGYMRYIPGQKPLLLKAEEGIQLIIPKNIDLLSFNCFARSPISKVIFEKGCSVDTIPTRVFEDCTYLSSVILPENLKNIGNGAFYNTDLETIHLPKSIRCIKGYSFGNAPLNYITYEGNEEEWQKFIDANGSSFIPENANVIFKGN